VQGTMGCKTAGPAGSAIPEIRAAEQLGPATTLLGFALNLDVGQLEKIGADNGFHCGHENSLTCSRAKERVDITLLDGRSASITAVHQGNRETIGSLRDETIFRFGLKRSYSGPQATVEVWHDQRSGISILMPKKNDVFMLILQNDGAR
jgi:hypothetical protein